VQVKKILAITGIRSEYDILYPVLKALHSSPMFDLKVIATGAHLSDWHGSTLSRIREDGFPISDLIDCLLMTNRDVQRAKGVGLLTTALAQTVEREDPSYLMVVGDREESLATAIAGNYMKTLVAHIGGGDIVYGNADDTVRFAVSEMAHVHLTMSERFAENLHSMGEQKFRIFNTGNPALDNIRQVEDIGHDELCRKLNLRLTPKRYLILIFHPLSIEKASAGKQMKTVLDAASTFCERHAFSIVGIYPNTDPGAYDIVSHIEAFRKHRDFHFFKTLPRSLFVNLLRRSSAILGNSSMAYFEAPFYGLPAVNVGRRQKGRLNAGNVAAVSCEPDAILSALEIACFDEDYRRMIRSLPNPFGDGYAVEKIVDVLNSIDVSDSRWYIKQKTWS